MACFLSFMSTSLLYVLYDQGKPFFFTFFVSRDIKLHATDASRVAEVYKNHMGTLISPPHTLERLNALGKFDEHVLTVSISHPFIPYCTE